ncbi:MAG: T9SS type A sorting domain-containing protein [Bacteroidales bacterium]
MNKVQIIYIFLLQLLLIGSLHAQIDNVVVECYYISDTLDATDTTGIHKLPAGSKTYRVFIDLAKGSKLKAIFGNQDHYLNISSSHTFYNNIDRPNAYFGYLINKSWFSANPTLALDSWLTIGMPTKTNLAVLKSMDNDGSFIGGSNNSGGSSEIPGGILVNQDTGAGLPLTTADGMLPFNQTLTQWSNSGFLDINGNDTTIFGASKTGSRFFSHSLSLQQSSGISGYGDENMVLVAQLTTVGEIQFNLNVILIDSLSNEIVFVSENPLNNERLSGMLTYPQVCGCKDPYYLEYSPEFGCNEPDSCKTLIILGCMDPLACNYNPQANKNVQEICCYPGFCNDRMLDQVCPDLKKNTTIDQRELYIFPNPASDILNLSLSNGKLSNWIVDIYNVHGQLIKHFNNVINNNEEIIIDVSDLNSGIYWIQLSDFQDTISGKFIKE